MSENQTTLPSLNAAQKRDIREKVAASKKAANLVQFVGFAVTLKYIERKEARRLLREQVAQNTLASRPAVFLDRSQLIQYVIGTCAVLSLLLHGFVSVVRPAIGAEPDVRTVLLVGIARIDKTGVVGNMFTWQNEGREWAFTLMEDKIADDAQDQLVLFIVNTGSRATGIGCLEGEGKGGGATLQVSEYVVEGTEFKVAQGKAYALEMRYPTLHWDPETFEFDFEGECDMEYGKREEVGFEFVHLLPQ